MAITLILAPQEYIVGDRPPIKGTLQTIPGVGSQGSVILTSADLAFATIRGEGRNSMFEYNSQASLLPEQVVTPGTDSSYSFDFNWPGDFQIWERGLLFVRAFYLSSAVSATLASDVTAGDTLWTLTVATGEIPSSGDLYIDDEACEFVKTSDTTITVDRANFQTIAAAHLAGTSIAFSTAKESALNPWEININTESNKLFDWDNFRQDVKAGKGKNRAG